MNHLFSYRIFSVANFGMYITKSGMYIPKFGMHVSKFEMYIPKFGIETYKLDDYFFAFIMQ